MEFRCFCGAEFDSIEYLSRHVHRQRHRFQCSCKKLFKTREGGRIHWADATVGHPIPSLIELPALSYIPKHIPTPPCNTSRPLSISKARSKTGRRRSSPCQICQRTFRNAESLRRHIFDKHEWCPTCFTIFPTTNALTKHQQAMHHCFCEEHEFAFDSEAELRAHKSSELHVTEFLCLICGRHFTSDQDLDEHLKDPQHPNVSQEDAATEAAKLSVEELTLYCTECNKYFYTLGGLRQHRTSLIHKPLSNMSCPLSSECSKVFRSPSQLVVHLEGRKCKSGMDRLKLNAIIHQHDNGRYITAEENVNAATMAVSGTAGLKAVMSRLSIASSDDGGVVLTPDDTENGSCALSDGGVLLTPTTMNSRSRCSSFSDGGVLLTPLGSANEDSPLFSGILHPAPIPTSYQTVTPTDVVTADHAIGTWPCPKCTKSFPNMSRLTTHLNSLAHAEKIFHCPTALVGSHGYGPVRKFKTLSGLAQHIEMSACAGGKNTLKVIVGMFEREIKLATGKEVKLLCDGT